MIAANGFTPGPRIIRKCPECEKLFVQETTNSGNTVGAKAWTDGKLIAPMLPDRPWLVVCPYGNHVFWIDEAPQEASTEFDIPTPTLPTTEQYYAFLESDNLEKEKEIYIRNRIWLNSNDPYRNVEANENYTWSTKDTDNVIRLTELFDDTNPWQRILKAEAYRELRMFDKCISTLEFQFDFMDQIRSDLIRDLAINKVSRVKEVIRE